MRYLIYELIERILWTLTAGFHKRRNRSRKRSGKSAYDLMKVKNRSRKRSHKRDGIGVRRIRRFPFLPTQSLTFRVWSSGNQIVGVGSRSGRITQSQCTFPRFVIGLVLTLLLPTPTIWFSQDHKRNVSDGVVSGVEKNGNVLILLTPIPSRLCLCLRLRFLIFTRS